MQTDVEFQPSMKLGISPRVRGRAHQGTRVTYNLWNDGRPDQPEITENIVLERFRDRTTGTHFYDGARLHPGVWRAVDRLLDCHPGFIEALFRGRDVEPYVIDTCNAMRQPLLAEGLKLPPPLVLGTMLLCCNRERVSALVTRHRDDDRKAAPGVPDLFLYVVNMTHRLLVRACFVEVKRHDERLMPHQAAELSFMGSLGLEAGVFRLRETRDTKLRSHAA